MPATDLPGGAALVDAATARAHLDDPRWRFVDCRHDLLDHQAGARAYAQGHLPGAVFAQVETELSGPRNGRNGRHPLPDRDALAATLGAWGIDADTWIVAYDAHGGSFAARLWWLARWLGHARVVLIDGGWGAWIAAGGPVATEPATPTPRVFGARPPLTRQHDAEAVDAARTDPARLLLDARSPERYSGAQETIDPVAGHIPGAIGRFWQHNLAPDGRFKPAEQLRAEFTTLLDGRAPDAAIAYCGSGVTGCHHLLAMEIAGLPGAALYPGSWSEWIADPARPVARGEQPG